MSEKLGAFMRLAMGAALPPSNRFEFMGGSRFGKTNEILPNQGLRGKLDEHVSRTKLGPRHVSGTINMQPSPEELAWLLPRILGGTASGTSYPLAENLPSFYTVADFDGDVKALTGCVFTEARFTANAPGQGDPALNLALSVEGVDYQDTTFPSLNLTQQEYFILPELGLTVDGDDVSVVSFELIVRYLMAIRWNNSYTRTLLRPIKRDILCNLKLPFDSDYLTGIYDHGDAEVPIVATFTNGGLSLVFNMPAVKWPTEPPDMNGRDEINFMLSGTARSSGASTPALSTTLDSTP